MHKRNPEPSIELTHALSRVAAFLQASTLTASIADIERRLYGAAAEDVQLVATEHRVDLSLLMAALEVRRQLGRISDLIHAAAILVVLPRILEPGEKLSNRPSLAAGNDPARPYDLETDRRIAEFKLAHWAGADAMRKRQTFKDLVHLAADTSGRLPELYVVGDAPAAFLRSSRSKAAWALDRSPSTRTLFEARFGSLDMEIGSFTMGPASHVRILDLTDIVPEMVMISSLAD